MDQSTKRRTNPWPFFYFTICLFLLLLQHKHIYRPQFRKHSIRFFFNVPVNFSNQFSKQLWSPLWHRKWKIQPKFTTYHVAWNCGICKICYAENHMKRNYRNRCHKFYNHVSRTHGTNSWNFSWLKSNKIQRLYPVIKKSLF